MDIQGRKNKIMERMKYMFCSKCGKRIPDNSTFCGFCGEKTEGGIKKNGNFDSNSKNIFLFVNCIIVIIVAIAYVYISNDWYKSNTEAFDWCNSSAESLGVFLHWAVCISACVQSFIFIHIFREKLNTLIVIKCGGLLIAEGIILKVLEEVFHDWSYRDDISIVLFRIFGRTYCNAVGVTVFMGILLVVSGVIMTKSISKIKV